MSQINDLNTDGHDQTLIPEAEGSVGMHAARPRRASGGFFIENTIVDMHSPEIGPHGLAVLVVLKRYSNKSRQCWPSLKRLVKQTRMSTPTVVKALRKLESQGLISRQRRQSSKGDPDTTLYTLAAIPDTGGCQKDEQGYQAEKGGVLDDIKDGRKRDLHEGSIVKEKPNRRGDPSVVPLAVCRVSPNAPARRNRTSPAHKTPLPDDFVITATMKRWAEQSPDITTLDIQRATNEWMDAMRAHGKEYVDWTAAWQNGMRRAQTWEPGRNQRRETVPEKLEGRVSTKTARSMQNAVRAAKRLKELSHDI